MVKNKIKKIKNKKNTSIKEPIPKVNKFKEIAVSIFAAIYGFAGMLVGLFIIIGLFTGFKYPWKWIDALYETENEKIEIIAKKWDNAYFPLIEWCGKNTYSSKFVEFIRSDKIKSENFKNYLISLSGNEKRCLEDKEFRIELINLPSKKIKENENLNKWFNEIPPYIKNFDINIKDNVINKSEKFIIQTNLFYWSTILNIDESELDLSDGQQVICAYTNIIERYRKSYCDSDDINKETKVFSVNFLSKKDFILLSKGCFNTCNAYITYIKDIDKDIIRTLKIVKPNLEVWSNYSDKDSLIVKEYDSMINKINYIVGELEINHIKPNWFKYIEIQ